MNNDNNQRISLNAWRGILGSGAEFIISAATMIKILYFGNMNKNSSRVYFIVVLVYCMISIILFWIAFAGTKEVITIPPSEKKVNN